MYKEFKNEGNTKTFKIVDSIGNSTWSKAFSDEVFRMPNELSNIAQNLKPLISFEISNRSAEDFELNDETLKIMDDTIDSNAQTVKDMSEAVKI